MKRAIGVLGIVFTLSGCAPSGNAISCGSYAESYNALRDAIAGGETPDQLWEIMDGMELRIEAAQVGASGDVLVQMDLSRAAVALVERATDDGETSGNFFYTAQLVQQACVASGNPIDLH